jgi:hypothetical protein
MAPHS